MLDEKPFKKGLVWVHRLRVGNMMVAHLAEIAYSYLDRSESRKIHADITHLSFSFPFFIELGLWDVVSHIRSSPTPSHPLLSSGNTCRLAKVCLNLIN